MAIDRQADKPKQDLLKPTEQHEGLPGYIDEAAPTPALVEPAGNSDNKEAKRPNPKLQSAKRNGR